MCNQKSRGPSADLCGTPKLTLSWSEEISPIETYCVLLVR